MEEGPVYSAVLFIFADGWMYRWTPGGLPIQMVTAVRFSDGPGDEFGVPPHSHDDVEFSSVPNLEGNLSFLVEQSKVHGPPQSMTPVLFKRVGRYVVTMMSVPPSPYGGQPPGYIVSAVSAREGGETLTTEALLELAKAEKKIPVQEHDHWFASEKPLPFSGALWVFQSVTEENIAATNCNCRPESDLNDEDDAVEISAALDT